MMKYLDTDKNNLIQINYWWHGSNDEIKVNRRSSLTVTKKTANKIIKRTLKDNPILRRSTRFETYDDQIEFFKLYWILQHDMRTNYEKIIAPCKNFMEWHSYYTERTPYRITSANNSHVTLDIQAAGQYSRLVIQTFSLLNTEKTEGGDTWRVHIYGKTSVPVTLVDNQDGSYEASFLIIEAGSYYVDIYLDYTLCDGFKDPPLNWFIKGNSQGKYQPISALPGFEKPFLEEKFQDIYFDVENEPLSVYEELESRLGDIYPRQSCFLWDGYGRWINDYKWTPYIREAFVKKSSTSHHNGNGVFWIYGDSIGDFFYRANMKKPLCLKSFNTCNRTYNWVYNLDHANLSKAKSDNDDNDFSIERITKELKQVLTADDLDEESFLFLNYGLHYVQEIPFATFTQMIDRVIQLIKAEQTEGRFCAQLVWKTTTYLNKWKWGDPKTNARHGIPNRFLTSARVQLYNAFSTSKLCDAGIKILDVYPLTYSYPNGTGSNIKPWDAVHYEALVFKSVEDYLIQYVDNDENGKRNSMLI